MKKLSLAGILAGICLAVAGALPALAADFEMNFTSPYFDRHYSVTHVFKPWMEQMKQATGGKVAISYFAPNTVCPEKEIFDSVAQNTLDLGANMATRNPGQLVAAEIVQFPMVNVSPVNAALSWWDLSQKYPDAFPEFKKIKLLGCWTGAMNAIHTVKTPVRKLEDMKGLRIITNSAANIVLLKALGATPMQMSNADAYLALERGMADGIMTAVSPLRSQKLTDILRFHTITNINCTPFWFGMSRELYNELPGDAKKAFDASTGRAFSEAVGKSLAESTDADIAWIKAQGKAEVIVLDDAERARWGKVLEPVIEESIKRIAAAGIPESTVREMYRFYTERVAANGK